jgi:hypothetical protein
VSLVGADPAPAADVDDTPIEVSGRVLDPQGRPFTGAKLYVGYSVRRYVRDVLPRPMKILFGATSGEGGRFHFTFARSELDSRLLDDSRPAVAAVADGFGPDWAEIGKAGDGTGLNLRLVDDHPVEGQILDAKRQAVAGAHLHVLNVHADTEDGVTTLLRGAGDVWYPRTWRGPFPGQTDGVTTDADGRFRLTGLGRDRVAFLTLDGPGVQQTPIGVVARDVTPARNSGVQFGAKFQYAARPSRLIRGVVRDKATGKAVAGVRVSTQLNIPPVFTDAAGRYEISGGSQMSQYYGVMAQPAAGQPYFAASAGVQETQGPDPVTVDLDLIAAVPLSGRVTDPATGKPPKSAVAEYYPLFPNPYSGRLTNCPVQAASSAPVGSDGSFGLAVLPGPGVVCIAASPRDRYAAAAADDDLAKYCPDRSNRGALSVATGLGPAVLKLNKDHSLSLIDPDEKADSVAVNLTLRPANALQGTVAGPDGQPLDGVEVVGLTATWDEMRLDGASFTVAGLNPRGSRELFFRHRGKELGKVMTVRGDAAGPLEVKLEPCGVVVGRVVDPAGKPAPNVVLVFQGGAGLEVDVAADEDGQFRAALLPGLKYSAAAYIQGGGGPQRLGDVAAESGQIKDVGKISLGTRPPAGRRAP